MGDVRGFDAGAEWQGIAPVARAVWGLAGILGITIVAAGTTAALMILDAVGVAIGCAIGFCVLGAFWWWMSGRRFRAWGYAARDEDLLVRRGLLIHRLTIVPYGRMQFVDLRQGPMARRFGLAGVQLHTAAAATDAHIPMLPEPDARRLADRLTALGEVHGAGL